MNENVFVVWGFIMQYILAGVKVTLAGCSSCMLHQAVLSDRITMACLNLMS